MKYANRQQIIRTIRHLYRRDEPLNITAVKRFHPQLIESVYKIKPFWGWKQALRDAGIDYAKIKVVLQPSIKCELCGKPCRNLINHVILKHQVTADDYRVDYPDSESTCEELRARQRQNDLPPIPHWDPVWSREYVLDRVAEYHRRGYPMHYGKFDRIDNPLVMASIRYAGGWRPALAASGIAPKQVTREAYVQLRKYPNKAAVIAGIMQRLKTGQSVLPTALQRIRGKRKSAMGLLMSAIEYFGSWANALKAAGLDLPTLRQAAKRKKKYETRDDVIREIRARHGRQWEVNHGGIYHGKHNDFMLGEAARILCGSWDKALRAAGFDAAAIHRQAVLKSCKYPSADTVLQALKQRIARGRLVNYSGVVFGPYQDSILNLSGLRYFGSWDNTLRAAGIDPIKVRHEALSRAARERVRLQRGHRAAR